MAVLGTAQGRGPLKSASTDDGLLRLWVYMVAVAVAALLMTAVTGSRRALPSHRRADRR